MQAADVILELRHVGKVYPGVTALADVGFELRRGEVLRIPLPVVIMLAVYAAGHFVLNRTKLGRYAYAIGGNEEAARLSGVNVTRLMDLPKLPRITLIGFLGFAAASCRRADETPAEGPTVALVMKTLNNPFFIDMQRGAKETAAKLGVPLLVQAAEREIDVEKQMQIIENLIQRKVGVLCITPSGSREIVPAIVKANTAGIPVLIVDTRIDEAALASAGGNIETFIGSDNVEGGRIAGEFVSQRLAGQGKVAILEGIPGHETGEARLRGFRQALRPRAWPLEPQQPRFNLNACSAAPSGRPAHPHYRVLRPALAPGEGS